MPSISPAPERASAASRELLSFLAGKDNPFDVFVAARKPDVTFPRYHVATIYREIFGPLSAVLDRYRVAGLERESDLPRSGVVVVLGARGTGKTHMVHALQRTPLEDSLRLVVAPSIYEPHRPFIEYLLHQLVRHFQNEGDGAGPGTLDLLADALARQVLVQAFYGMTDVEWLARNVAGRRTFWQLLLGWGTRPLADRKRLLITDLQQPENRTVLEVCERYEQDPLALRAIALQHIDDTESGHTPGGQIRRGLYTRLVRLAFGEPREEVYDFLLDGYTQVEAKSQPSRQTLVDELFQSILELCLLARMPVVFAFDALESLLGDPPDAKLCHPFFKGLADVLDSHRGIPFLLFAERGHWQQMRQFRSDYVTQRLQQGVIRVPHYGSVSELTFPPVSAERLAELAASRLRSVSEEFHGVEEFDAHSIAPFSQEDLKRIARGDGQEPPLRQALQQLRDRYDELVNGNSGTAAQSTITNLSAPPDGPSVEELEGCWQTELRSAGRRLEGNTLASLADELHAGIALWMKCLIADGTAAESGRPTSVVNEVFGGHPTYGQLTKYEWESGSARQNVGLGLLVGTGPGMPRDLDAKLKMIAAPSRPVDVLVLLWPKGADPALPPQDHFPPGTRGVWDQYERSGITSRLRLRMLAPEELAPWLALPRWLSAVRAEADGDRADLVNHFVAERLAALLNLVNPRS
jgi:hypothetical protein